MHLLTVSLFRVRLPPPVLGSSQDSSSNVNRFTEGEEIEVFSRASDQESCGWWRAVIKMIKGEFHVVEYLGWETTYTEVRTDQVEIIKMMKIGVNQLQPILILQFCFNHFLRLFRSSASEVNLRNLH